jgi:SAM-dependent methyltransferase
MTAEEGNTPGEGREDYRPRQYWTDRLSKEFSLRGVGHGQYSEAYNGWIYRQKARTLRKIVPAAPVGGRALDVGSGIGWVVAFLQKRGWTTDGCDISEVAVTRLRERFPSSTFETHAFGEDTLPQEAGSYDLVTMLDVTYHVVDDALWERGIRELARVLKPGGSLVLLDRFGPEDVDAAAHVRFRSLARWDEATAEVGLRRKEAIPAYRWLSRPRGGALDRLPGALRGAIEFSFDQLPFKQPHMRCARYIKRAERSGTVAP